MLELLAFMSFKEINGRVHLHRRLIFIRLTAVSVETESSSFVLEHDKFFMSSGISSYEYSLPISIAPDNIDKQTQ